MQTPWNINLFKFSSVLFRDLDNTVKLSGLDSGLNEDRLGYCARAFCFQLQMGSGLFSSFSCP